MHSAIIDWRCLSWFIEILQFCWTRKLPLPQVYLLGGVLSQWPWSWDDRCPLRLMWMLAAAVDCRLRPRKISVLDSRPQPKCELTWRPRHPCHPWNPISISAIELFLRFIVISRTSSGKRAAWLCGVEEHSGHLKCFCERCCWQLGYFCWKLTLNSGILAWPRLNWKLVCENAESVDWVPECKYFHRKFLCWWGFRLSSLSIDTAKVSRLESRKKERYNEQIENIHSDTDEEIHLPKFQDYWLLCLSIIMHVDPFHRSSLANYHNWTWCLLHSIYMKRRCQKKW